MNADFFICNTSGWALIEYVLYWHILWWISYYFLLLMTKQSEEWCCRFLTLVHGCVISYSAIRDIIVNKAPVDFTYIPISPEKKAYLSYMLSYFLFDFSWIHFFGNETWVIYAHHVASILIISHVLVRNYGSHGIAYGTAGLELTNPYLQLRWFLRTHGYLNKPVHTITELWFFLLFFLIRMIGGTTLLYYAFLPSKTDWAMKISFLSIYGISLVLQWQIFVYFRKKYLTSRSQRAVNFMQSRVSISPFFQKRTLDNSRVHMSEDSTTEKQNSPVVTVLSSLVTGPILSNETPLITKEPAKSVDSEMPEAEIPESEISERQLSSEIKKESSKPPEEPPEETPEEPPEEPPEEHPEENKDGQNEND